MKIDFVVRVFVAALLIGAVVGCQPQQDSSGTGNIISGRQINANCVVTFFRPGIGNYYSRQNHQISLDSQSIIITADEPQGKYTWKVSGNGYNETSPAGIGDGAAVSVMNHAIVRAILVSFTASAENNSTEEKVKIEGRWYWPIELGSNGNLKTTVYKRVENNTVELVHVENINTGKITIGKPFNRGSIQNTDVSVSTKIDILGADSINSQPELILQVNYKSLETQ